jgi:general stress protein 26
MTKYSLQKEANLIKQKYMTQKTTAQNIKNHLKSSTENEMIEELKRKPMLGQFYQDIARPSVGKEKSLAGLYCLGCREKQRI